MNKKLYWILSFSLIIFILGSCTKEKIALITPQDSDEIILSIQTGHKTQIAKVTAPEEIERIVDNIAGIFDSSKRFIKFTDDTIVNEKKDATYSLKFYKHSQLLQTIQLDTKNHVLIDKTNYSITKKQAKEALLSLKIHLLTISR